MKRALVNDCSYNDPQNREEDASSKDECGAKEKETDFANSWDDTQDSAED